MNPDFFQQLQEMQRRAADLQKNLAAWKWKELQLPAWCVRS
jgi:hypothetical protein